MWLKTLARFFKSVTKPVSIFIIPHNGMPSLRFNLPVSVALMQVSGKDVTARIVELESSRAT